ncbi:MAG: DUF192 domain-containing protein [Deltaproteobacteria bacterium]|nr:DUF192 domain-containing protein [Deltaproteobacteria bacterium]
MGSNQRRHRVLIKQAVFLVLFVCAAYAGIRYYLQAAEAAHFVKVQFQNGSAKSSEFRLEVVASQPERAKGLMFRRYADMADDQGMLFIFPDESPRTFWMKNTLMPLDMIFADAHGKVVGIVANATPLSEEGRGVATPAKYVIELHGGTAKKAGIAEGSVALLPSDLPPGR